MVWKTSAQKWNNKVRSCKWKNKSTANNWINMRNSMNDSTLHKSECPHLLHLCCSSHNIEFNAENFIFEAKYEQYWVESTFEVLKLRQCENNRLPSCVWSDMQINAHYRTTAYAYQVITCKKTGPIITKQHCTMSERPDSNEYKNKHETTTE